MKQVQKEALKIALDKLDVNNDEHWTENGLPRVDAVNLMVQGDERYTREDLNKHFAKFNRETRAAELGEDEIDEDAQTDLEAANTKDVADATNPPKEGSLDTTPPAKQLADPAQTGEGFQDSPAGRAPEVHADPKTASTDPVVLPEARGLSLKDIQLAAKQGMPEDPNDHVAHIKFGNDRLSELRRAAADISRAIDYMNQHVDRHAEALDKKNETTKAVTTIQDYHRSIYGKKPTE